MYFHCVVLWAAICIIYVLDHSDGDVECGGDLNDDKEEHEEEVIEAFSICRIWLIGCPVSLYLEEEGSGRN
jgi:hypothetical protein